MCGPGLTANDRSVEGRDDSEEGFYQDIQKVYCVGSRCIAAVDEISQAADQTWKSLEQRTIDGLVSDFKRRCQLVLECKSESISGVLLSHMSTARNMISTERATVTKYDIRKLRTFRVSDQIYHRKHRTHTIFDNFTFVN